MESLKRIFWRGLVYYGMFRVGVGAFKFLSSTFVRTFRSLQNHKSLYASKTKQSYAVITGGSGGLGFSFAKQLAAAGFNIALIARDAEKLEKCASELRGSYEIAVRCIKFDFSDAENSNAWIKLAEDLHELDIAILVNNLGAYSWVPFEKQTKETIQTLLENCVYSNTFMTRIVVPNMLQRETKSAVINVGSFAGEITVPTTAINCGVKRYIHRLTLSLAREYENTKIDFLCVIPGLIDTPGLKDWKAGVPILVSSPEAVAATVLSEVKSANQKENITFGTVNHAIFSWLFLNSFTRKYFTKKVFALNV